MGRFRYESDEAIDRLLAGKAPTGEPVEVHVAQFVDEVRTRFLTPPSTATEQAHLAAIVMAAENARTTTPDVGASPRTIRRRRSMLSILFGSLAAKVAAAATAAVVAAGGAAAAGALPDPAQEAVANAAQKIGISLPNPADEDTAGEQDAADVEDATEEDDKRVDDDVRTVLDDDSLSGREKGDAVSDAADANRQDGDRRPTQSGGSSSDAPAEVVVPSGDPTEQGANPPSGNPGYGTSPSDEGDAPGADTPAG